MRSQHINNRLSRVRGPIYELRLWYVSSVMKCMAADEKFKKIRRSLIRNAITFPVIKREHKKRVTVGRIKHSVL